MGCCGVGKYPPGLSGGGAGKDVGEPNIAFFSCSVAPTVGGGISIGYGPTGQGFRCAAGSLIGADIPPILPLKRSTAFCFTISGDICAGETEYLEGRCVGDVGNDPGWAKNPGAGNRLAFRYDGDRRACIPGCWNGDCII